jgi:hypothetical protein
MHKDCTEKEAIRVLEANSQLVDAKVDLILENQKVLATDLKQTLDRLTSIIEEDIGTRKDVEQGKKERELLFVMSRRNAEDIAEIKVRNARCDGAGIFDNFPKMWNWFQQHETATKGKDAQLVSMKRKVDRLNNLSIAEQSIKKFVPLAITLLVALTSLWLNVDSLVDRLGIPHTHESEENLRMP